MNAEVLGDSYIAADRGLGISCFITAKAAEHGAARAFRFDAAEIFAGKRALRDRRIGEEANLFFHGDFGKAVFERAIDETVGVLNGDDARQGPFLSLTEKTHDAISGFVRNADMADLAGAHEVIECGEGFLERHSVVIVVTIAAAVRAKELNLPVRPVELIKIDVVRLQVAQGALDSSEDLISRQTAFRAVADPGHRRAASDLSGDDHLTAVFARRKPAPDNAFGFALGLRFRRDGVKLGSIEEIDPAREAGVHLFHGVFFADLVAKHHCAEAQRGHVEISAAKTAFFHCGGLLQAQNALMAGPGERCNRLNRRGGAPISKETRLEADMETSRKTKLAMLAATALIAASGALAPVQAGQFDPAAFPQTVEAPVIPDVAHAADHADQKTSPLAKRLGVIAVAGAALAGLIRILGAKRVMRVVKTSANTAAKAAASAATATASVAGRALRSPLRYIAWVAGLTLFALTGVGLYDIEWIGGLIAGAALAGLTAMGMWKTRMALRPVRVKARAARNMANEN